MRSTDRGDGRGQTRAILGWATAATFGLCAVVVVTAWEHDSALGAPRYWAWLLTGLQVTALWAAGSGRRWGWLLGGSVQVPWIAYALMTNQLGFIPGCLVSASVQLYSYCRNGAVIATRPHPRLLERTSDVPARVGHSRVPPVVEDEATFEVAPLPVPDPDAGAARTYPIDDAAHLEPEPVDDVAYRGMLRTSASPSSKTTTPRNTRQPPGHPDITAETLAADMLGPTS